MVLITPSSTQVFSPFGSYVVERHDAGADLYFGCDEREHTGAFVGTRTASKSDDTLKAA